MGKDPSKFRTPFGKQSNSPMQTTNPHINGIRAGYKNKHGSQSHSSFFSLSSLLLTLNLLSFLQDIHDCYKFWQSFSRVRAPSSFPHLSPLTPRLELTSSRFPLFLLSLLLRLIIFGTDDSATPTLRASRSARTSGRITESATQTGRRSVSVSFLLLALLRFSLELRLGRRRTSWMYTSWSESVRDAFMRNESKEGKRSSQSTDPSFSPSLPLAVLYQTSLSLPRTRLSTHSSVLHSFRFSKLTHFFSSSSSLSLSPSSLSPSPTHLFFPRHPLFPTHSQTTNYRENEWLASPLSSKPTNSPKGNQEPKFEDSSGRASSLPSTSSKPSRI